jgi:uncharacterized membrane protein
MRALVKRVLLGLAASVALAVPSLSAQPPATCTVRHYSVVAVPMQPAAINDAGQVAGTTAEHRAAVWTLQAGLRELPLPPGFFHSAAVAINNRGHILGIAYDHAFSNPHPFTVADDILTLLPGDKARAYHISETDVVAGESMVPGKQKPEPVVWSGNFIRLLGSCCGGSTKSINDNGDAIGDAYDADGRYYAYLWTGASGLKRIGPPDRYSSAIAINNVGRVVIQAVPSVFLYSAGASVRLSLSPKYPSHPHALNDCDVIVGSFGPFSDADRAFVWEKTLGFQDLNTLIPPAAAWKLESATGINNRGEIVGKGAATGSDDSGFLLTPAP